MDSYRLVDIEGYLTPVPAPDNLDDGEYLTPIVTAITDTGSAISLKPPRSPIGRAPAPAPALDPIYAEAEVTYEVPNAGPSAVSSEYVTAPGDAATPRPTRRYRWCIGIGVLVFILLGLTAATTLAIISIVRGQVQPNVQPVSDVCLSSPCANGGICVYTALGYHCVCPSGFSGTLCLSDIYDCEDTPCVNGGTCADTGRDSFKCTCPPGYTGRRCADRIDECASSPCENGATCLDLVNAYSCTCPCGWSGQRCDVAAAPPPCPSGYTRAPDCGHCYRYDDRDLTWQEAHDHCASTPGAYLAEVDSQPENDYIQRLHGSYYAWLGGRLVLGELTWSHSGVRLADYTRWASGEPDGDGECVIMYAYSGRWYDYTCSYTRHAVCEHDG